MNIEYSNGYKDGIDEAVKRIESFKNKMVLQMRLKINPISDEYYQFVCKLVDAEIKLLNMKPSENT